MTAPIHFYYAPHTRALSVRTLLDELAAPYELHVLDVRKGAGRTAEYLAINPMGKVPAIKHGEAVITEQVAIFVYLADLFPQAELAPGIDDPLRGPYLRWLAFYAGCFEPALMDKATQREAARRETSPYGTYELTMQTLLDQLAKGPYIIGERFTAADVLWGAALNWTTAFKLVPETPVVRAYIERVIGRPASVRTRAEDARLAAQLRP